MLKFPSPCGEKVGINEEDDMNVKFLRQLVFPSPCGEKVGINALRKQLKEYGVKPTFPSPCGEKVGINAGRLGEVLKELGFTVSVPLRGKGRDQHLAVKFAAGLSVVFPSPCGEKVGINKCWAVPGNRGHRGVSVPLRGKGRDQQELSTLQRKHFCRFRPLAGKR